MPRRNNRQVFEPLDFTPVEIPTPPSIIRPGSAPVPRGPSAEAVSYRRRCEVDAIQRERTARINGGMDWSVCLVPGCGNTLTGYFDRLEHDRPEWRDHTLNLPLCFDHLMVAYRQSRMYKPDDPVVVDAVAQVIERRQAKLDAVRDAEQKAFLARSDGQIYYVRLNGLIKVGWSRALRARLKDYGPDVQVLCHYPATRQDETLLHRQLKPYLAKGREWYQDCELIQDLVTQAIAQHGEPTASAWWTEPKVTVAAKNFRGSTIVR